MTGTDQAAVLHAQRDVLDAARTEHQTVLAAAVDAEAHALAVEQRAHDVAADALAKERAAHDDVIRSRVVQVESRHAIREISADINEIDEALRTIPEQRREGET